jgi:hypothetical protein
MFFANESKRYARPQPLLEHFQGSDAGKSNEGVADATGGVEMP